MLFEVVLMLGQQLLHLIFEQIELFVPPLFLLLQMLISLLPRTSDLIATK